MPADTIETTAPIPALSLDHIAQAVPDLEAACEHYRSVYGCEVTEPKEVPEQGIRIAYVLLSNAKIELMTPVSEDSPVAGFLNRMPKGGLHHFCLTVPDAAAAASAARAEGLRVLGDGTPKPGHHGHPLFFLHPGDCQGALTEIEEHPEDQQRTQ